MMTTARFSTKTLMKSLQTPALRSDCISIIVKLYNDSHKKTPSVYDKVESTFKL